MPTPGRIRITKNSQLTTPLLDYRGVANNFIEWNGQFQITEFENENYIEFDFEENEWYFNMYATLPGTYLNNLLDVTITNLTDKDVLSYNILTGEWENSERLTEAEQDIAGINTEISNINNEISNINTQITNINQTSTNDQTNIQNQINSINSTAGSNVGGIVPEGGIIMWSGTTVPAGWSLCDGSNGTPNLVDRFIIGSTVMNGQIIFANDEPFVPGGAGSPSVDTPVSLTINQNNLPNHTHNVNITTSSAGAHSHTIAWTIVDAESGSGEQVLDHYNPEPWEQTLYTNEAGAHTHSVTGETSNGNLDNEPMSFTISAKKWYALAFIMRKYGIASRDYTQAPDTSGGTLGAEVDAEDTGVGGGFDAPLF